MATLLSLSSQPLMELASPAKGDVHDVSIHQGCETTSEVVRTSLPKGAMMYVLETREMPDGEKRARVVLKGEVVPLGWLTLASMDGTPSLRPAFARPLYAVVKAPVVRKTCSLTSEIVGTLPVGTKLNVVEYKRMADGSQRCCVVLLGDSAPYGWLTARRPDKGSVMIREVGEDGRVKMAGDELSLPAGANGTSSLKNYIPVQSPCSGSFNLLEMDFFLRPKPGATPRTPRSSSQTPRTGSPSPRPASISSPFLGSSPKAIGGGHAFIGSMGYNPKLTSIRTFSGSGRRASADDAMADGDEGDDGMNVAHGQQKKVKKQVMPPNMKLKPSQLHVRTL